MMAGSQRGSRGGAAKGHGHGGIAVRYGATVAHGLAVAEAVEIMQRMWTEDEVSFENGDLISDVEPTDGGWVVGTLVKNGKRGLMPGNYLKKVGPFLPSCGCGYGQPRPHPYARRAPAAEARHAPVVDGALVHSSDPSQSGGSCVRPPGGATWRR